jgi:hypothetical protein
MNITGYQLSQVANAKLADLGMEEIPSQMVYNYIRSGTIPIVLADGTPTTFQAVQEAETKTKYFVTVEDAKTWIANYIGGKRNTSNSLAELLKNFEDEPAEVVVASDEFSEAELAELAEGE